MSGDVSHLTSEQNQKLSGLARLKEEYLKAESKLSTPESDMASQIYENVNDKPLTNEAVDILVRVPKEAEVSKGAHEKTIYHGPHYGKEDVNVISSIRMDYEDNPNYGKIARIKEIQSDWGQDSRKTEIYEKDLSYFLPVLP